MIDIINIRTLLNNLIKKSPHNKIKELDNLIIYDEPLVGISSVDDPLFETLKHPEIIGPHHMTPKEWLPQSKSVISYFLPFSLGIRGSNRKNDNLPSTEWLYGRIEGEDFNNIIRRTLASKLASLGIKCIVPPLDSRFKVIDKRSNWSERHVAYISGLGTFNLGKNLITKKGCAGRFGSIILDFDLTPTKRPYEDIYEYCNNCGACIRRCPAFSITENGKDHISCDSFLKNIRERFSPRYGCGKCQTNIPCENRIPKNRIESE